MLSTILGGTAVVLAFIAVYFANAARLYALQCYEFVEDNNKRSLTLNKLAGIQTELTEHDDAIAALADSMKKLRGRVHARTVNANRERGTTESDEDWKRRTNARLANP